MSLKQTILEIVKAFKGTDSDRRSSLGMARTWVEKQKEPAYNPLRSECRLRDVLTRDLVTALHESECEDDEMIAALANAREVVNAPFQVASFVGTARLKPKDQK